MTDEQIEKFIRICLDLSSEQDREKLLSSILDTVMDLTNCDAGTLYLLEDDGLHFCRMVTRSMHIRQGGHADPITLPPVPLNPDYVCARSVLENKIINVADVRDDTRFNFSGSKKYDEITGYYTKTMLVIPMANDQGVLIGVFQLINALDAAGQPIPFPTDKELLVRAVASQAAISLTNMQYSIQITALMDSLVDALSTAIDERTPYNANHSKNMVRYATTFLHWLDKTQHPLRFDENKKRTFLLSVWLHDVGKLVVPLEVMDKESRLGKQLSVVEQRFYTMKLLGKIAYLEGKITAGESQKQAEERESVLEKIRQINRAGFLPDADGQWLQGIAQRKYQDENGAVHPWLTPEEIEALSIRKGTLTDKERAIMQSHVVVTSRILAHVSFPKSYAQVPLWAGAHHELLNGKGYPNHLTAADIPWEVRLLTILDVFDALTARDRPYKAAMPLDTALRILHNMAQDGEIDAEILQLFEQSKAWEGKF